MQMTTKVTWVLNFLRGKKTYIIGSIMILLGMISSDERMITEGAAFMTMRAAIN